MTIQFKVTEDTLIAHAMEFLSSCDSDELGRITGEMFGARIMQSADLETVYTVEPTENYMGEFSSRDLV